MKKQYSLVWLAQFILVLCFGQDFNYHSISPFGIQTMKEDSSRPAQKLMFFDFDGDEDLDLFLSGLDYLDDADPFEWENIHWFIEMQENMGDKWNPAFGARMEIPDFPYPLGYFFPTIGDLNDDGKQDFIISAIVNDFGNRTATFVRSMGSKEYEVTRLDSMGLIDFVPESFFIPELVDLDVDGDLDILMSGFDPAFAIEDGPDVPTYYYAKNIGTPADPEFLGWFDNPYGLMPNPLTEILTGGDIDNDGDVDLIGPGLLIPPDSINYLYVHLNTPGVNKKPAFNNVLESPYGLPMTFGDTQLLFPNLVDIDGDGDLDLFVFQGTASGTEFQYYENNLCPEVTTDMSVMLCEGDAFSLGGNTYTEAGNYTIHLQASNGCDSIILLTIDLVPLPNTILSESICEGETFVIGNESFTASGDYTVYIVAANGCDSIINLSLVVIDIDNSVQVNQNVLVANSPFATFQWFNCDSGENIPGATNQSYEVLTTGNYAVSITVAGCSSVSECIMVVITGIEVNPLSDEITIYPNPTDNFIYILNETSFPISNLSISNITGQFVEGIQVNDKITVDVSSLGQGVYFIRMTINNLEIIKKLIIF